MKRQALIALVAALALVGCKEGEAGPELRSAPNLVLPSDPADGQTDQPSADPGTPAGPTIPVVVNPAPADPQPTTPAPTAPSLPGNTVQSDTDGAYTCAKLATGEAWCSDGVTGRTIATTNVVKVVVAGGLACAMRYKSAPFVDALPSTCSALESSACVRPPTYYEVRCWTPANPAPTLMRLQQQLGTQPYQSWVSGVVALTHDSSNQVRVDLGIYNLQTNPYGRFERQPFLIGTQISGQGYLVQ